MSYLLDKKIKRKKLLYIALFCIVLFILFYFRSGIWNGLSYVGHRVFSPILVFGNNIGGKLGGVGSYFISKNSLYLQNKNLQAQLNEILAQNSNYNSILVENESLKEILNRKNLKAVLTLSAILSKPNQSIYDTLVIDVGTSEGIKVGDMVFALGNVPIGRISDIYPNSSKVILFSNSGEKTQAVVGNKNIFMEVVGRGGGNFEMIIPRDLTLVKGDQVTLPGITPYVIGVVETIISDPRDPFTKALLVSPVNIQELKFVEIEIQK